jgi:hypothetical protein
MLTFMNANRKRPAPITGLGRPALELGRAPHDM